MRAVEELEVEEHVLIEYAEAMYPSAETAAIMKAFVSLCLTVSS